MPARRLTPLLALLTFALPSFTVNAPADEKPSTNIFDKQNLLAWCIVPFDSEQRTPVERARMLRDLGIHRLAYDYRAQHIPSFDQEIQALKEHDIELTAWWFPQQLNDEARLILDVLKRHDVHPQLWISGGGAPTRSAVEQRERVLIEAARIRPIAEAAQELGCQVGLYNHGGWFGQPENQLEIVAELDMPNVGIVYNLHHGHEHLERLSVLLEKMKPHLMALNLNGMVAEGDQQGQKILPLGAGDLDLKVLETIRRSGYSGPIGILNHTDEDARARLQDNLDGLAWLVKQLDGQPAGPRPAFRSFSP